MFRRALLCALVFTLVTAAPALASPGLNHNHRHRHVTSWSDFRGDRGDMEYGDFSVERRSDGSDDSSDSGDTSDDSSSSDSSSSDVTGVPSTGDVAPGAGGTVKAGAAQTIQAQLTAYDNSDNQGGNNATICCGVLHKTAGGTGTFADPITVAVPGSGGSGMQTPAGTRLYIPSLAAYFVVEDSGASPETLRRFDIWIDGRGLSSASACMDKVTRTTSVILNPPAGKPVGHVGPIADASGCHVATSGNG